MYSNIVLLSCVIYTAAIILGGLAYVTVSNIKRKRQKVDLTCPSLIVAKQIIAAARDDALGTSSHRVGSSVKAGRYFLDFTRLGFLAILFFAFFAPVIANDRPLFVMYKGQALFPFLKNYKESRFGGFLAVTDFKDPVIRDEIENNGLTVWPIIGFGSNGINKSYPRRRVGTEECVGFPAPPYWSPQTFCDAPDEQMRDFLRFDNMNWLGTDDQGCDVLARLLYATRLYLLVGFLAATTSALASVILAFSFHVMDFEVGMATQTIFRWTFGSMPTLLIMFIFRDYFGDFTSLVIIISAAYLGYCTRRVNRVLIACRNETYMVASRSLGSTKIDQWRTHLWKPSIDTAVSTFPAIFVASMSTLAALDVGSPLFHVGSVRSSLPATR